MKDKKNTELKLVSIYEEKLENHMNHMSLKDLLKAMHMIYEIENMIDREEEKKTKKLYLN